MPKEKEEGGVFFVGIKDPIEIRRSLLESSKEMLQYLQRAEKFKEVRKEKEHEIAKLKAIMKEIKAMARKVKASLPKTGLRAAAKKPKPVKKAKKKTSKKKEQKEIVVEAPKEMNEIEKLESELGEIEGRLNKLA